jgi:hypothetical protein
MVRASGTQSLPFLDLNQDEPEHKDMFTIDSGVALALFDTIPTAFSPSSRDPSNGYPPASGIRT